MQGEPSVSNIFLDTEFYKAQAPYKSDRYPISIALVSEDGNHSYYAIFKEFLSLNVQDLINNDPDQWVKENVVAKLPPAENPRWKPTEQIAEEVKNFILEHGNQYTNIWQRGDTGDDNDILYNLLGGAKTCWDLFRSHGIQLNIRDSITLRQHFSNFVPASELKQHMGADKQDLIHTAIYDAQRDQQRFQIHKNIVPPSRFNLAIGAHFNRDETSLHESPLSAEKELEPPAPL